jgi:two-component system NtrC family response regulator
MARVLVIDDDHIFRETFMGQIAHVGYHCDGAENLREGVDKARKGNYDLIFLDVLLPDGNGLKKLEAIKNVKSSPEIVIITGNGDPDGAELAITSGAWDYIQKPAPVRTLQHLMSQALDYHLTKQRADRGMVRNGIIGHSPKLGACLSHLSQAAATNSSVLITGETGTGKELFAKAIHENSRRAQNAFVVVDCTSIPENLAESLLFGHLKGSFTGAHTDKMGLFLHADGGSLFLDEIGDLSLAIQKSLLRVLQERKFRPIGSKSEKKSDFRLIAATNRDLAQMVKDGTFRKDLYYRLRAINIHLPPLRERRDDLDPLLAHYIPLACEEHGVKRKKASPEVLDTLRDYHWPGNVRELVNTIHAACANARDGTVLYVHHLPLEIRSFRAKQNLGGRPSAPPPPGDRPPAQGARGNGNGRGRDATPDEDFQGGDAHTVPGSIPEEGSGPAASFPTFKRARRKAVDAMEADYLMELIEHTGKDIPQACRVSGLSRARLYELLKKHNVGIVPRT